MYTVLNNRMLDALDVLRLRGRRRFACYVLADGTRQTALLGPRVTGRANDAQVLIAGEKQVVAIGQISVERDVLAVLLPVMAELDAEVRRVALTDTDAINRRLWERRGTRAPLGWR